MMEEASAGQSTFICNNENKKSLTLAEPENGVSSGSASRHRYWLFNYKPCPHGGWT